MYDILICKNCKEKFEKTNIELICKKCKNKILIDETFLDFSQKENFEFNDFPKKKLTTLFNEIKNDGFEKSVNNFLNKYPEFSKQIKDIKSADFIFHFIKKENLRCLEIGSGFGKNIDILAKTFQEVYSMEWNREKIEIQKIRFKENGFSNVKIIREDPSNLPFENDSFDLVICNGIFELIGGSNNENKISVQKNFLNELKRIIKNDGCFLLGVENGSSFGGIVEKDSQFKKFNNIKIKHSFQEYQSIFSELKLHNEAYWALPSISKPYFSGKIEDKNAIKWFYENYNKFLLKEKQDKIKNIAFSSFGKLNNFSLNLLAKKFFPNFIFCCYKNENYKSYKDDLLTKIKFSSFMLLGRRIRLIFILFDKNGKPKKLISLERFGNELPENIQNCERKIPFMKDPSSRVWIEQWMPGQEIDPTNSEHLKKSIDWLIDFQKKSKIEELSDKEKKYEVDWFRKRIKNFSLIDKDIYKKWLDDYEEFLLGKKIHKVSRHGDFWYSNILFDKKMDTINVIDWENFSIGNPVYDLLTFILHVMTISAKNPVEAFKESLEGKGIFGKFFKLIDKNVENHLGFDFDLILLLRFFIIRNIIRSKFKGKKLENHIKMMKILSEEKSWGFK